MAFLRAGKLCLMILLLSVLSYVAISDEISEAPSSVSLGPFSLVSTAKSHELPRFPTPAPAPKPPKKQNKANKTHAAPAAPAMAPAPGPAKGKARPHKAATNGTLDPAQVKALHLLGVTVGPDACNTDVQQLLICDTRGPLRHLVSLQLEYCPSTAALSKTALASLSTLRSLSFLDCPMRVAPLPPKLAGSLESFTCTRSLGRTAEHRDLPALPGVWLSQLRGLTELTVKDVLVNASGSGLGAVLGNMSRLQEVTFSNINFTGTLPKSWPRNLTALQISGAMLNGSIPSSISNLTELQSLDLSFNNLMGRIPDGVGGLKNLQMLSLSSNRLSGGIPRGFKNLTLLSYLDLSNNHLNGTVPAFIANINGLRYLDLSNNKFHGVLPFTTAFVKNLNTFKVGTNPDLCFNDSILVSTISGGADPCDSKGKPSKAAAPAYDEYAPAPEPSDEMERPHHKKKGPKTVVLAVSIALASLVLVIIIAVVLSRWCARKH